MTPDPLPLHYFILRVRLGEVWYGGTGQPSVFFSLDNQKS